MSLDNAQWDVGGGTILTGSEITYSYPTATHRAINLSNINYGNVTDISCDISGITKLDLRGFDNLTSLSARYNNLSSFEDLHINNEEKLIFLNLEGNNLTSIKIPKMRAINNYEWRPYVNLYSNNLTSIDLTDAETISYMSIAGNNLDSIIFPDKQLELERLYVNRNGADTLEIPDAPKLKILHAYSNNLTRFNINTFPLLQEINISDNNFSTNEVDRILYSLVVSGRLGVGYSIDISSNSPPTNSKNVDILRDRGWTVTTDACPSYIIQSPDYLIDDYFVNTTNITAIVTPHDNNDEQLIIWNPIPSELDPYGLIIVDRDNHNINVYDKNYNIVLSFPSAETYPTGVVYDFSTNSLITCYDYANKIYVHDGVSQNTIASIDISHPVGLALDNNNNLICVSNDPDLITIFNGISSSIDRTFSTPSTGPRGITVDKSTGNLISCDYSGTPRIIVHDGISPNIIETFNSPNSYPSGLTYDENVNDLISCDYTANKIYIHNSISSNIIQSFDCTNPQGVTVTDYDINDTHQNYTIESQEFHTNFVTISGDVLSWSMGDGNIINDNKFDYIYNDGLTSHNIKLLTDDELLLNYTTIGIMDSNIIEFPKLDKFLNTEKIFVQNNNLTELNISNNNKLLEIYAHNNNITELDTSNAPDLNVLQMYNNSLTSLDLSNNLNIGRILIYGNQLSQLDVSMLQQLYNLSMNGNNVSNINLTQNTNLIYLEIDSNNVYTLDISNNTKLQRITTRRNNLTELDISNNTKLTSIYIENNNLSVLDVSICPDLSVLYIDNNNISTIDISNNPKLIGFRANSNGITTIDLSNNPDLSTLALDSNNISQLDLTNNTSLEYVYISDNDLTSINLSNNSNIKVLYSNSNNLTSIDVSACDGLWLFSYASNNMSSPADTSQNPLLRSLYANNNNISSINISSNIILEILEVSNTNLSSLDLSSNTNLLDLRARFTNISSLDLSNNIELLHLNVGNSYQLSNLDISSNIKLETLTINTIDNITYIDISNNTKLINLNVSYSGVTKETVNELLYYLDFHGLTNGSFTYYNTVTPSNIQAYNNLISKGWSISGSVPV